MEPIVTSGGPGPGRRFARWARLYRLPILLSLGFFSLLTVMIASSGEGGSGAGSPTVRPAVDVVPARSPCPACRIGERCQGGRCVLEPVSSPECAKGSRYDEKEGFCVPLPTPKPTPLRSAALPSPSGMPTLRPPPTPVRTPGSSATPASTSSPRPTSAAQPTPAAT